jgi:hypothetical protein
VGHGPHPDPEHELVEVALEAEQLTGTHEPTVEAARPHLLVRIARICAGFVVVLAGISLLVLPGPGLALIVGGLTILAVDIPFARRLRTTLIEHGDRLTGFVPPRLKKWLLIGVSTVAVGLSLLVLAR